MSLKRFVDAPKKSKTPLYNQEKQPTKPTTDVSSMVGLQNQFGNQVAQRLLAQRASDDGSFELDENTTEQINQERGNGQALEGQLQEQMGQAMGHDFSEVNIHTSQQSDVLSRKLGAKAFTTGNDVFFRQDTYDPSSSSGQELIAHELTHVVQQSSGMASSGRGMTVNSPNDAFEQEADAVAQSVTGPQSGGAVGIQREAEISEEEDMLAQAKSDPDIQREEEVPEEEMLSMKSDPDIQREAEVPEEEMLSMKSDPDIQREEEVPEEEMLSMKSDPNIQREAEVPEEEMLSMKSDPNIQREEEVPEDMLNMKPDPDIQREDCPDGDC